MQINIIKLILQQTSDALTSITDQPMLEAEVLLAHVLEKPRAYLIAWPEQEIEQEKMQQLDQLLTRRLANEPLAYITYSKEFWSLELVVTYDTLIPRPETELLVETLLAQFPADSIINVADLGTGSGAIALALAKERPQWQIVATDASAEALKIAKYNAAQLGIKNIAFYQGDWCAALPHHEFSAIVSNPPYISETEWEQYANGLQYEPRAALVSGKDGLEAIREIIANALNYLLPNGDVFLEHGYAQALQIKDLFEQMGYENITTLKDLAGLDRVTWAAAKK